MKNYENLKNFILSKKHRDFRFDFCVDLAEDFSKKGLTPAERMTERFELLCKTERPVVFKDERIAFIRTIKKLPDIFTESEWQEIKNTHFIHELGFISNVCPDYAKVLKTGIAGLKAGKDGFSVRSVNALIGLCERYIEEAKRAGNDEVAENINAVINGGAQNFAQALQLLRIVHFGAWLEGSYHVTAGSFDRYAYPYYKNDIEKGVLTKAEADLLVEEYFLSFNRDSDLYPGVQQGDNGQSMVLGGTDENGNEVFNELSSACLKASASLLVIDPKINIRVSKNTPLEVFELGTELTAKGLGFPQYTNDDIAIPALEKLGYEHGDAVNYVMAACWELIIPSVGADVANISALSFAKVIDKCLHRDLLTAKSPDEFFECVKREVKTECDAITSNLKNLWFVPSPFMNALMACDVTLGGKYNNFGIHGTGICTAADSLAAIKQVIFEEKFIGKNEFIKAVDSDFAGYPELLHKLRYECKKVGNNDDGADKYLVELLKCFSDSLSGKTNCRGGKFRAGTGSAMYYIWHANEIGASPDGRRKGEPLGANFSVSLFADVKGPLSVISSLVKPDFLNAFNGGPVTLEFTQSMWKGSGVINKFAKFVKYFFEAGGHQLQLNSVNAETLKDAQKHPENYERLIVRVWGWSAYFTELNEEYQNHVIARQEYKL